MRYRALTRSILGSSEYIRRPSIDQKDDGQSTSIDWGGSGRLSTELRPEKKKRDQQNDDNPWPTQTALNCEYQSPIGVNLDSATVEKGLQNQVATNVSVKINQQIQRETNVDL